MWLVPAALQPFKLQGPVASDADRVALLPANIAELADGLDVDIDEVWLHLAVRETARMRLFTDVPWVGPQIIAAVEEYARGIAIDTSAVDRAVAELDPSDVGAMQQALTGSLFNPQPSPAQQAALMRLETWLALIEGWVDVVTARAAALVLLAHDVARHAVAAQHLGRARGGQHLEAQPLPVGDEPVEQ